MISKLANNIYEILFNLLMVNKKKSKRYEKRQGIKMIDFYKY